jgi:rod shape-determining protein MreC
MAGRGGNRSRLLLVILLVTSLFLITLDLRGISLTSKSRSVTQSFLSPIQRGVSTVFSPVGNLFSNIRNFGTTKSKIDDLKRENAKLKAQVIFNEDTSGKLKKLRGALNLAGRAGYTVIAAQVIGKGSASTFSQTITLDAGAADGVKKDMTVIGSYGLVGVVKEVTASSAVVLLMSDPTFRVGVRVARSQSIGVVIGEGDGRFVLQLLDPAGDIKKGDVLLSLGSDGNRPFVPGVPVGRVTSVSDTSASLTQNARVQGFENLNSLGVVAIITKAAAKDPRNALVPTPEPTVTVYVTPKPVVDSATTAPTPTPSKKGK